MKKMRTIIRVIIALIGFLGGLYVGGWLMFIQPIMLACQAYDMGTLTAFIIGSTILKCLCSTIVGGCIMGISFLLCCVITE